MSDFARVMEMALAAGTAPEEVTGRAPPPLAEQLAENEKAQNADDVRERRVAQPTHDAREHREKK